MSANISLLGWMASGLRCPDHEVNLCPRGNKPSPVTLVQMPNGTGKTTTLNLLRATLSGVATGWTPAHIQGLRRSGDPTRYGRFITSLKVNDKQITFELNIDYEKGAASYRTSLGSGVEQGFKPPRAVARFLAHRFVDLFIFDGELANHLLDSKTTRARDAIDALFQLSLFDDLTKVFRENWDRRASTVRSTTEQGLTSRRNRLRQMESRLGVLKLEAKQLRSKLTRLRQELRVKEEEYSVALTSDNDLGRQITELKKLLSDAEDKVSEKVKFAINNMRNPHLLTPEFASSLQHLKSNFDRLKLPTSTSKEFFEELVRENECICGRPLDEESRQAIRDRTKLYLAEDEVGVLNNIKSDIALYCDQDPSVYYREHQEQLAELGAAVQAKHELETALRALEERRLAEGDMDLEEKKKQVDLLKEEVIASEGRLAILESDLTGSEKEDTDCLKALEDLIARTKRDVAEATETVTLSKKTDIASNILKKAQVIAREELRKLLVSETNERIRQLLPGDPVLLSDIRDSLMLEGQEGASVGQTLSVSYAFLATLFNRSDYGLPFVVDSPAGALDLRVRPEVAKLIPQLCKQFVAFTISSEREGFADPLDAAAGGHVQYLTVFRQTHATEDLLHNLTARHKKTKDGVIVEGKEFFDSFDQVEEER